MTCGRYFQNTNKLKLIIKQCNRSFPLEIINKWKRNFKWRRKLFIIKQDGKFKAWRQLRWIWPRPFMFTADTGWKKRDKGTVSLLKKKLCKILQSFTQNLLFDIANPLIYLAIFCKYWIIVSNCKVSIFRQNSLSVYFLRLGKWGTLSGKAGTPG